MSEKHQSGSSNSSLDMSEKSSNELGGRWARSPEGERSMARNGPWKASCDVSLGGVIASCRRRSTISTVFKTLGMRKVEPTTFHVSCDCCCPTSLVAISSH